MRHAVARIARLRAKAGGQVVFGLRRCEGGGRLTGTYRRRRRCDAPERGGPSEGCSLVDVIDITFDFRSDTPPGRDPDAFSPTLRRYHQLLWSKPLPSGAPFELDVATPPYLHHASELGEFWLSSDAVIPSFSRWVRMAHIIDQIPEVEREAFNRMGYTIGGMMVFPANKVDGAR